MNLHTRRFARCQVLAIGVVLIGAASASAQLRPDQDAIELAPPELIERLRANPFDYFRFVNRPWVARVCGLFAEDVPNMPSIRLHGDAHVEQFAVTADAWGLDDFDDSARGPCVVDIVRFLGSLDLAARQREWTGHRQALFNRFFAGYRWGLANPNYRSPQPNIVGRLRVQAPPTRAAFLAWGEKLMAPMDEASEDSVVAGMNAISHFVSAERPDLPPGYLTVVRAGWLRMGVGSAVSDKILIRTQGPSKDPDDDELVEAKRLRDLSGLNCLQEPPSQEPTRRVITGTRQLGRLKPRVLAAGPELVVPELVVRGRQLREWWIRSWDPSYRELTLSDLRSVQDLAEIAYDSGVQLGAGSLKEEAEPQREVRARELATLARLERRIRYETSRLVEELLLGWKEFGLETVNGNRR
jgi:Uncharacterized protein conserved in bacteria (DUF2252)